MKLVRYPARCGFHKFTGDLLLLPIIWIQTRNKVKDPRYSYFNMPVLQKRWQKNADHRENKINRIHIAQPSTAGVGTIKTKSAS